MNGLVRCALLAATGLAAAACSGDSSDLVGGSAARVDTLDSGRIHVTNHAPLWTPETAWTLTEEWRLGCVEGCGPELFTDVSYLITDEDELLYVLDWISQEIRVFSPEGAHIRTMGGEGGGPGELERASGLDWAPDGRLWVWGSTRYTVLEPDGTEVARHLRPGIRGVAYPWMGGFAPDGRYIDFGFDMEQAGVLSEEFPVPTTTGAATLYPIAMSANGRPDSLPTLEFTIPVTDDGVRMQGAGGLVGILDQEGDFWFALPADYTVYRRALTGDTVSSFSLPVDPIPLPEAEIDSVIAARPPGAMPTLEPEDFLPVRQVVSNILTDPAGHVYVFPQEVGVPQGSAVDVFERSGVYLGRMAFPETILTDAPSPHITNNHIYAVVEDELGIQYVARYRIERP